MLNTWLDQKACKYCRRPVLETHGDQLYCPTCDTTYYEDDILSDELEVVSGPSVDVFERNVNLIMQKGGPYRDESGHWRFTRLLDKFGIDTGAFAERWILAASHLWYLYYASQIRAKYPNSPRELLPSQTPPLRSKRSTSGYFFTYLQLGTSPFTFLSNDSFVIIMNSSYNPKTNYPFIPKSKQGNLYYYLNGEYQQGNWKKGIEGLLAAGLIEHAPFETNLALLPLEKIRQKLKEYGLKRGKNKDEAIVTATKGLPENILHDLIKPVQGYVPTALTMKEFRLWDYEIRCLQDAVRYHNLDSMEKKTEEEYAK